MARGIVRPSSAFKHISESCILVCSLSSDFLNMSNVDAVCLQHEYGIFGGEYGAHVIKLLQNINKDRGARND